ncbi:MAG: TIGR00266 family protein [Anaerolineae bacterium]|nr:TIGR00266 family protein [Anaerolineae bacterium]
MDVSIQYNPAFSLAVIKLAANEEIKVEPGAMVSHTDGMSTETKAEGGLFGGLKRMVAGESFFQNTWKAPANGGEITLAPSLPGDMTLLDVGGREMLLASGAYVASEMSVTMDSSWGGAKGFFGGGGLILLKIGGRGKIIVCSYGAIFERTLAPGERYTVDTDHIVALDSSIQFSVQKSGSWKSTILGGEGLVCQLNGPGRVLMQSRSTGAFLGWLLPKIPSKS